MWVINFETFNTCFSTVLAVFMLKFTNKIGMKYLKMIKWSVHFDSPSFIFDLIRSQIDLISPQSGLCSDHDFVIEGKGHFYISSDKRQR